MLSCTSTLTLLYAAYTTRVLGLSASMLAGWNSHQTTPGPGATVQKSRDSLAVQSPILAGWCNASNRTPIMLPKNRKPDLLKGQEIFNKLLWPYFTEIWTINCNKDFQLLHTFAEQEMASHNTITNKKLTQKFGYSIYRRFKILVYLNNSSFKFIVCPSL